MTNPAREATFWPSHSLCVLVPAYNAEVSLDATTARLIKALSVTVEEWELIIVDDGSTDRTGEIAARLAGKDAHIRVLRNDRRKGLGYCYNQGIAEARKSYFVYVPGDNTWPERSFVELFGQLGKADVITSYSSNPETIPPIRHLFSRVYTWLLNTVFGFRLRYFNGLTVYPLSFLRTTTIRSYGFGFQAEILLKAVDSGLSHVEVAIPIDPQTASAVRIITAGNVLSTMKTLARLYMELRVRREGVGPYPDVNSAGEPPHAPLRIIVTGGSGGIGAVLVRRLAADGHMLFVCARHQDLLDEATRNNTIALGRVCDVAEEEQVKDFMVWVRHQTPYIDAVINSAGGFGAIGPIEKTDSREWLRVVTVNLFGSYLVIKHALRLLSGSKRPRIINFAGGGAFGPFRNYSAYASSKAAIVRLTECLAAELAPDGIAVNAVAPGFVATRFHEATLAAGPERAGHLHFERTKAILEGQGVPVDVPVDCVRFLLSDGALGLTGKTLSANFDPWRSGVFRRMIREITLSELYTMRRVNIVNLPQGSLRTSLTEASARQD